ncbi:putative elongation of very long chain fatty acids protein 4 isoform X1, partial [Apostichopus japonicus]
ARTKNWFLMSSPYLNYSLVVLYLIIVWKGQQLMESRRPLQLKNLMMFYNFAMVLLNGYMFIEFVAVTAFNPKFSLGCQAVDYSNDDKAVRLAAVCWWFYFSKLVEFADTFIFMLRKKNNQISFLHVYHHATMPMLWWVGVRWVAGGASYFSATVNCFIHILMYSYYFLSALGPWIQPFLWWKRYLTSPIGVTEVLDTTIDPRTNTHSLLPLLQFILVMIHAVAGLFQDCAFPRPFVFALVSYLISHIILFSNFYFHTYTKPKKVKGQIKEDGEESNGVNGDRRNSGRYNLRERPLTSPKRD